MIQGNKKKLRGDTQIDARTLSHTQAHSMSLIGRLMEYWKVSSYDQKRATKTRRSSITQQDFLRLSF